MKGEGIRSPCPGTAHWIQSTHTYHQWFDESTGPLWLTGDMGQLILYIELKRPSIKMWLDPYNLRMLTPGYTCAGSGKSVLCKHLVTSVIEGPSFSFFFSRMRSDMERSPMTLVASLLSFVTTESTGVDAGDPSAENQVFTQPSRGGDEMTPLDHAWYIIHNHLRKRKYTIILDGLDECAASDIDFISFMGHLTDIQQHPDVRVLVSGRPHARLVGYMNMASWLQIQLECDLQRQDIWAFLSTEIERRPSLASFHHDITQKLVNLPGLNFQHVHMLVMHVDRPMGRTISRTRERIYQFPLALSSAYQTAWEQATFDAQLDKETIQDRRQFLMLILGAQQPLTMSQMRIAHAVQSTQLDADDLLFVLDFEEYLRKLCYPFIRIHQSKVSFIHSSVIEFFLSHVEPSNIAVENPRFSPTELQSYFAWKCLFTLSMDRYRSLRRIGMLLRSNMEQVSLENCLGEEYDDVDDFYEYAARNWVSHLVHVPDPEHDLLRLASDFLGSPCFAHWTEYVSSGSKDMNSVFRPKTDLVHWRETLSEDSKKLLDISKFLEKPYSNLIKQYQQLPTADKELPLLCLFRMETYYMLADASKAFPFIDEAVRGLTELLGKEHPMTLRVRVEWAKLLPAEKIRYARDELLEIWNIQREVLPPQSHETSVTLQVAGLFSYFLAEFKLAEQQLDQAYHELGKRVGNSHYETLCTQLYLGYVLTSLGRNEKARRFFSEVYSRRTEAWGVNDGLSIMSLCARGQSERIAERLEDASQTLRDARVLRIRNWRPMSPVVIDTSIHLSIAHRESGKTREAQRLLDELDLPAIKESRWPRYCQIKHLQALLLYDEGNTDLAVHVLELLVNERGREHNNRWLLWARLSLAKMKTDRGEEDEAIVLFDNIIQEKGSGSASLASEPDSPMVLRLAKDLVELVRQRRYEEVELRLQEKNYQWVREEDFWIVPGGPIAETGWMKGPWPDLEST